MIRGSCGVNMAAATTSDDDIPVGNDTQHIYLSSGDSIISVVEPAPTSAHQ